ncbi:MAG: phosphonate ABC transporter ATP-binding protein [Bacteroidetes bacterium HGW-Bacteroidetes-21]|jgi:cell division transport system ATP-binding protein|nr:MAG: phosphonate ABC transporter ATP-binding protein [Bacteroidetes bacterium HGW-Bacteroidetes-21]
MTEGNLVLLENVSVAHQDTTVIEGLNLMVDHGSCVYLTGRVGSGKTSILRLLYGDLSVYAGNAMVCGYDLTDISQSKIPQLRKKLGIVFQDFQLLPDRSVKKNLEFVLKATGWKSDQFESRINEVLLSTGMTSALDKMPSQLSGGEQQKVSIARALLNDPELILADEPTGNLDPVSSVEIFELLIGLVQQGKGVIIATHNYQMIEKYPQARILYCSEKQTREIGVHELNTAE